MASFNEYKKELANTSVDQWLGQLVFYTVAENARIKVTDLEVILRSVGLQDFAIAKRAGDDVFRSVCTAHQRRKVPTDVHGVFENYLIRDVSRENFVTVKHIVVEEVDSEMKVLAYEPQVSLEFDGKTERLTINWLGDPKADIKRSQAMAVADLIKRDFRSERNTLHAYALREQVVRRIIVNSNATAVRGGGGLYFMTNDYADRIAGLLKLSDQVEGIDIHTLPLIDSKRQRQMIRKAYESEAGDALNAALDEADKYLTTGKIRQKTLIKLLDTMEALDTKTGEYSTVLEDSLSNVELKSKVLKKKMQKLLAIVEGDA